MELNFKKLSIKASGSYSFDNNPLRVLKLNQMNIDEHLLKSMLIWALMS